MNRDWKKCLLLLCFAFILTACKQSKMEQKEIVPIQDKWTFYETQNTRITYTMDDKSVYTIEISYGEKSYQMLCIYDFEGNKTEEMDTSLLFGKNVGVCELLAVEGSKIYVITQLRTESTQRKKCLGYDTEKKEVFFEYEIPLLERVYKLLSDGDNLYCLGTTKTSPQYKMYDSNFQYCYQGEKILRISQKDGQAYEIGIEKPVDITLGSKKELVINEATENGFRFVAYHPEQDAIQVLGQTMSPNALGFAMWNEDQSIVYVSAEDRQLTVADLVDLSKETKLYPQGVMGYDMACTNGKVLFPINPTQLILLDILGVKKENREINLIASKDYSFSLPYNCGYQMVQRDVSPDKLALKILAQDKDYDLCLIRSTFPNSKQLKESGCYASLNSVRGIQEYLDLCFPYVKEAATTEDGEIWMLPIKVDIPFLVYDSEDNEVQGLFRDSMTYEEFSNALTQLSESQLGKTVCDSVGKNLLTAYWMKYRKTDTEEFRSIMKLLMSQEKLWKYQSWVPGFQYRRGMYVLGEEDVSDFYLEHKDRYGENGMVISFPKLDYDAPNYGSCDFFVLNPNTDNYEATIAYLEDYIAYAVNEKTKSLIFTNAFGSSIYENSLYHLYENGAIVFENMWYVTEGYTEVLEGTKDLEEYIRETDAKLRIYFQE